MEKPDSKAASGGEEPRLEFRLSREARERYAFEESLYSIEGNVIHSDYFTVQALTDRMNETRDLFSHPESAARAGQINAGGLISAILHYVAALYRGSVNPGVLEKALAFLVEGLGRDRVDDVLLNFVESFPPLTVYRGASAPREHLEGETAGIPNRQLALENLLLLFLQNDNPAFSPFRELFDDRDLAKHAPYREALRLLGEFYGTQPVFGPEGLPLAGMLKAPAVASPHSLEGQLAYIRSRWSLLLPTDLMNRILLAADIIREETQIRMAGPGTVAVPDIKAGLEALEAGAGAGKAYERFSEDSAWMPRVVLLAKNVFVWLDQLSRRYARPITRLDQIPDRELDKLARWGFTGLWLIGAWERSHASRKIKQACGNSEAASSAYSLYDYVIAAELGGEKAMQNLRERAWRRGIRLSSDMVPNHTGICSRWIVEHPEWFIQTSRTPFPRYRFTGMDLSDDPRMSVYLEDGYWTMRDAAVVFKRVDRATGEVSYIYHGNDGTSMPWNDTAQIDFLKAEVREAVIQTILHVARKFPIIRFDAAMVLTKMHFQRLWYPPAGAGGAIPSRAGQGLSGEEFDRLFPHEFWREVVDRVAKEVPDTLLLAEAFWLLEGYFVRTLGMHRVYNSAFMNMLKMEMNSEYRKVMKDVLEFDPQILKRFVNFMSNPDEATAVLQFGRGDKYFGVCMMMVTMPGLPLLGHGQIEGLSERYGMEYRKAYWNEPVDTYLVRRHEAEIFPLMKKRYLFSNVENFSLYDFFTEDGRVNEDVFAYSNHRGSERALIVYYNRFGSTSGWIRTSVARAEKDGSRGKKLSQVNLARGLALKAGENDYCIFRDLKDGLQYVRRSRDLADRGLHLFLNAYQYHVFMDFREVSDRPDGALARLERSLGGRGVPDINEALRDLYMEPLHRPLAALLCAETLRSLVLLGGEDEAGMIEEGIESLFLPGTKELLSKVREFGGGRGDVSAVADFQCRTLRAILLLFGGPEMEERFSGPARCLDELMGKAAGVNINKAGEKELRTLNGIGPKKSKAVVEHRKKMGDFKLSRDIVKVRGIGKRTFEKIKERIAVRSGGEEAPAHVRDGDGAKALAYLRLLLPAGDDPQLGFWRVALPWAVVRSLGLVTHPNDQGRRSAAWIDEWRLGKIIARSLRSLGCDRETAVREARLVKILSKYQAWWKSPHKGVGIKLKRLLKDRDVQGYLQFNRFAGALWFRKERFEELVHWLFAVSTITAAADARTREEALSRVDAGRFRAAVKLLRAARDAGYRVRETLRLLQETVGISKNIKDGQRGHPL